MEIASEEDFIKILDAKDTFVSDLKVTYRQKFTQSNYSAQSAIFKDCHFEGKLMFHNCEIHDGIRFINCQFDEGVEFLGCSSKKIAYIFLSGDKSIEFIDCKINSRMNIRDTIFDGGFNFVNSTLEDFHCYSFRVSKGGGIELRNNTNVARSLFVSNCNLKNGRIIFYHVMIAGHLRFENNVIGGYDFSFSKFSKNIFVWAGNCNSIIFYQSHFDDDFNIQVVKVKQSLSIIECQFKKVFKIELDDKNDGFQGYLNSLYMSESEFLNAFKLYRFSHSNIAVAKIDLVFTNLSGSFHFDNIAVNELNISGYNKNSRLVIDEVNVQRLSMNRFRNSGSIDFIKVNPMDGESELCINHSILGTFSFVNCRVNAFQKFVVDDSVLDLVVSSGTKWFDFKQIAENYGFKRKNWFVRKWNDVRYIFQGVQGSEDSNRLYQIREIFRQLKTAMDKQGNRIQALFFQSQEFQAYKRELELSHEIYRPERLIIWSNASNSHGQNWIKPIGLGVVVTVIIFVLMVYSMNERLAIHLPWKSDYTDTLRIYATYIKSLPELFNPTFRMNLVFPKHVHEFTFMTFVWALVQRISISYFIFQTISAFRKYIK